MRKICAICILIVLAISVTYASPFAYFMRNRVAKEIMILADTKQLPVLKLVDCAGQPVEFDRSPKYKLVFSLSSTCSHCISMLDLIERLCYFNDGKNLSIYAIWNDTIPTARLEKKAIPAGVNYGMTGDLKLTLMTPDCLLLDEVNNIVYVANAGFNQLMREKVLQLIGEPPEEVVVKYIRDNFAASEQSVLPVFFSTDDCSGCMEEKARLENYRQQYGDCLQDMIEIGHEDRRGERYVYDQSRLFSRLLGVEWYPIYVLFDLKSGSRLEFKRFEDVLQHQNDNI